MDLAGAKVTVRAGLDRLTIYPDAMYGFLFEHYKGFATDVVVFLAEEG
jgi:hypothetical protein